MPALVGLTREPVLELLIEMGPALKCTVAQEEVLLEVADYALVLVLGAGAEPDGYPVGDGLAPRLAPLPGSSYAPLQR